MTRPENKVDVLDIERGRRTNRLKKLIELEKNLTLEKWHGKLEITFQDGTIVSVKKEEQIKSILI